MKKHLIEKTFLDLVESKYFIVSKNGTVLNTKTGNLLGNSNTKYYINITFGPRNARISIGLHRLVWLVFRGPIPKNKEINHKNGIKKDNRLSNLELVTRSQNTKHAYDIGISPKGENRFPERSENKNRLKKKCVRLKEKGWSYADISRKFDKNSGYIYNLLNS